MTTQLHRSSCLSPCSQKSGVRERTGGEGNPKVRTVKRKIINPGLHLTVGGGGVDAPREKKEGNVLATSDLVAQDRGGARSKWLTTGTVWGGLGFRVASPKTATHNQRRESRVTGRHLRTEMTWQRGVVLGRARTTTSRRWVGG